MVRKASFRPRQRTSACGICPAAGLRQVFVKPLLFFFSILFFFSCCSFSSGVCQAANPSSVV